jgi:N-methylhydantoinase B/oxoprolinase/acetone carboxylase alpha subunit
MTKLRAFYDAIILRMPENEWFYPIIYLWRKELPDSGGAGKFRRGNSGQLAFVAQDTDRVNMYLASAHNAIPGLGRSAGYHRRLRITSYIATRGNGARSCRTRVSQTVLSN